MASAERIEPSVSKRPSACSRELCTDPTVITRLTAAKAIGMTNSHGQVTLSISTDDTNRPRMPPAPAKPDQMPTARARCSAGKLDVITDSVTGMIIAAATPAAMRAASSIVVVVAKAAAPLETTNSARPATRIGLRPQRSPMAPTGSSRAARAIV